MILSGPPVAAHLTLFVEATGENQRTANVLPTDSATPRMDQNLASRFTLAMDAPFFPGDSRVALMRQVPTEVHAHPCDARTGDASPTV